MKLFTTKQRVMRYEYDNGWRSYQILHKYYYILSIKVFSIELDREDIPSHVYLKLCCFGDCGGWTSKFMPFGKGGWKD